MPSGLQADGTFMCKPCQIRFPTWERLLKHKDIMRRAGKAKHIHCKFCGMDFKTEVAHMTHIHQSHPQAQDLQCPGCHQGPFAKLGGLLHHIQNECSTLDVSFLEHLREEKMEFATQLQAITNEPVKANYAHYMPAASGGGYDYEEVESKIEAFKLKKEFPDLCKPESTVDHADNKENIAPWEWDSGKKLFPDAPPAQKPTKEQLEAAAAPGPQDWDEWLNVNDPTHPKFNVARYYQSIIDKYACPVIGCGKTFKNSRAIIGHLKSPAHSGTKYRCPYCLRTFNSLAAITSHAEDSSVRCRMRETDTYGALIDQLTGGLADVSFRRHDDGTVKYEVSKNFRRKAPEPSKPKPSKSEPLKTELSKPQPPKAKETEPVKPEPLKPAKTESSEPQPLKTELSKPLPLKAELLKTKQFEPSVKAIEIDPWTGSQITR
ncbi:C2H2-type domain-containing protein [Fusarium falciforme]|uniref:C2H2-type domain-containing protein n=1 Tax=Fusarium falciforme TaxID=195108 RepID=UPI0022FFEEE3|nr:C2H2-type domain-containing protein [Fusarium falciforme]WAO94193.1 C2H2-type domain-containing protein [Fusarium falciforme]